MHPSPVSGQNDRAPMTLPAPLPALLLASLLLAAPIPTAAQDLFPLSDEHKKWLEYEVVYIVSDREKGAFERLQSEAEREAFIAAFWRRRDPEPLIPGERVPDRTLRAHRIRQLPAWA